LNGPVTILATTTRMPLNHDAQHPLVVPSDLLPALSKIGGNSPDAADYNFPISSAYSDRLRGTRGKAPFFNLQVRRRNPRGARPCLPGHPLLDPPVSDRWHETADFRRRTVHYNDHTIKLEPDGSFRAVVISPEDPGVPNGLDTGGRTEGYMSFKWVPGGPLQVSTQTTERSP
jgi:hypothetical protein